MKTCLNREPPAVGAVTVIVAVPLFPSEVAVIVVEPVARPVTSPVTLTRATPESLLDQVTTRPLSGAPLASLGVAVSCTVWPICRLGDGGLTVTEATVAVSTLGEAGEVDRSQLDASAAARGNGAGAAGQWFEGNCMARPTYRGR